MFGRRQVIHNEKQYVMDEVVSALQKAIRRGQTTNALYWAHVMYSAGYWNAAFIRLKIITMEDAAGNLALVSYVKKQFDLGLKAIKAAKIKLTESNTNPTCLEALNCAVIALCEGPKTRCLNFWLGVNRKQLMKEDLIPLNQCLAELQSDLKRSGDLANKGESLLIRRNYASRHDVPDADPHKLLRLCLRVIIFGEEKKLWEVLAKYVSNPTWLKDFGKHNAALTAAYALAQLYGVEGAYLDLPFMWDWSHEKIDGKVPMSAQALEIPDEAVDKHTSRGAREKKRGWDHFSKVGSVVTNELFADPWSQEVSEWYAEREAQGLKPKSAAIMAEIAQRWGIVKKTKRKSADPKKEPPKKKAKVVAGLVNPTKAVLKDPVKARKGAYVFPPEFDTAEIAFKLVDYDPMALLEARYTQMPCGMKPGCLVGADPETKNRVFVKGPESFAHTKTQLYLNNVIKPKLGLQYLPMEGLQWNDKFYIRMNDLSDQRRPTEFRRWRDQDIPILSGDFHGAYSLNFAPYLKEMGDWDSLSRDVQRQYLAIVIYRKIFGVSDTNPRNFFVTRFPDEPVRIYSVDETVLNHDAPSQVWMYSCPKIWIDELPYKFAAEQPWIQQLLNGWEPSIPKMFMPRLAKVRSLLNVVPMQV